MFAIFFSYRWIHRINALRRKIYSISVAKSLFKAGNGMSIMPKAWIEGGKYISIGDGFFAMSGLRIEAYDSYQNQHFTPRIVIGDNVNVGDSCHIGAVNSVEVGNNVLMGSRVYITDHQHGKTTREDLEIVPRNRPLYCRGKVVVEDNVWIGDGVVILPNVKIGHNSVVGANAVVTRDVPAYSIVAGVPAKVIKTVNRIVKE